MISVGFILTSLIVVLVPGTGVIYTVTTSLSGSRRKAVFAAFGCTLGILPHILAAVFGLSVILNMSAQIMKIIKIAGVIYLVYLGIGLLRSRDRIEIKEGESEKPLRVIGKAILLNLLNPKLTLFFLSFLPQFISPQTGHPKREMIFLSLIFMGLTFVVFLLYGLLANSFKQLMVKSPKVLKRINRFFGIVLIGFAGKLALEE